MTLETYLEEHGADTYEELHPMFTELVEIFENLYTGEKIAVYAEDFYEARDILFDAYPMDDFEWIDTLMERDALKIVDIWLE